MKKLFLCILSFFVFFSTVDLSVVTVVRNFSFNFEKTFVSDVMKVQYDILQQTKSVVVNVCSNIMKDVNCFLSSAVSRSVFFNADKINLKLQYEICFNFVKTFLYILISNIDNFDMSILFFLMFCSFMFSFILKYLGLLFTFGKINNYQQYIKAYTI